MTLSDVPAAPEPGPRSVTPSRRGVLAGGAALAAGTAAALTVSSGPAEAATPHGSTPLARGAGAEPLMAHVRDVHTGAIDIFIGSRHVEIHDREIAVRLANAAR